MSEPVEKEPEEPKEPENAPEAGLEGGDMDLEAEVLFQVSHYSKEYGAPASVADIAFEIVEKDSEVHEAMMDAVYEGTPKVKPILKQLVDEGLIIETEFGGYVTTPEGDAVVTEPETQEKLGDTYESEKHKGNPADESSEPYELDSPKMPTDEEIEEFEIPAEDKNKKEGGVPFLTM